jgi:hypothetical protein
MFTSLSQAIAHNLTLAGEGLAWNVKGTSRPRSDAMRGLRAYLWTAQEGICAACGEGVAVSEGEVAHVVGNGLDTDTDKMRGYVAGNLYFAHEDCNMDDADVFGHVVPATGFARPELVALTLPGHKELVSLGETFAGRVSSAQADARARRLARRLALRAAGNVHA